MNIIKKFDSDVEMSKFLKDTDDFKTEKELCEYIEINMEIFCEEILGGKLKRYQREWYLTKLKRFGPNKPRIDFFVELEDGREIGIECKNPKFVFSELVKAISQLLVYGIIAEENNCKLDELVLVISKYDDYFIKVIRRFKLPLRVFVLSKQFAAEIK